MFVEQAIRQLQRLWRGPPLRVRVADRTYELGPSPPPDHRQQVTEVVIERPGALRGLWTRPSLAFGEAYMRGDVEVRGSLMDLLRGYYETWPALSATWTGRLVEGIRSLPAPTPRAKAMANAQHHYDLGNDFYRLWLDPSLTYSCAYFLREDDPIATAQRQKNELLCRKARLQPGQRMLDIGCGWGALLFHAAEHHGVEATGITPAGEQADHIEAEARRRGLADRVRVIRGDWRDLWRRGETYDRIISVGMFEHVGREQYGAFFEAWRDLLAEGGLSILHTIGRMRPERGDPWIGRYIFPGGYLPTLAQLGAHAARARLPVLDVENLRQHYACTLACWAANFNRAHDRVTRMFGERFVRMWWLYLRGAEAAFRWGGLHLWQTVLARDSSAPWPLDREVGLGRDRRSAERPPAQRRRPANAASSASGAPK